MPAIVSPSHGTAKYLPNHDTIDIIEYDLEIDDASADGSESVNRDQVSGQPWWLLIVDDDPEVHTSTAFALADTEIPGRHLKLSHAHSASEALSILRDSGHDIAVILLDVVMETDDAGLRVVRVIREELGLAQTRQTIASQSVPTITLSASERPGRVRAAVLSQGANR